MDCDRYSICNSGFGDFVVHRHSLRALGLSQPRSGAGRRCLALQLPHNTFFVCFIRAMCSLFITDHEITFYHLMLVLRTDSESELFL